MDSGDYSIKPSELQKKWHKERMEILWELCGSDPFINRFSRDRSVTWTVRQVDNSQKEEKHTLFRDKAWGLLSSDLKLVYMTELALNLYQQLKNIQKVFLDYAQNESVSMLIEQTKDLTDDEHNQALNP